MKTLIAIFLVLFLSIPAAWAGEIDGKGVWCDNGNNSYGYWFEDGKYLWYRIKGYEINLYKGSHYTLLGTSTIQMGGVSNRLDRTTLKMDSSQCYLVTSREELEGILRAIIDKGKAENKL